MVAGAVLTLRVLDHRRAASRPAPMAAEPLPVSPRSATTALPEPVG
jgi:hypothetical protein